MGRRFLRGFGVPERPTMWGCWLPGVIRVASVPVSRCDHPLHLGGLLTVTCASRRRRLPAESFADQCVDLLARHAAG